MADRSFERAFPGELHAPHEARLWIQGVLLGAGLAAEVVSDAQQVLGELAANAVEHSRSGRSGGVFTVRLLLGATLLRIEVADQGNSAEAPMAKRAAPIQESGHGLDIVAALALRWWTRTTSGSRTVVAELKRG